MFIVSNIFKKHHLLSYILILIFVPASIDFFVMMVNGFLYAVTGALIPKTVFIAVSVVGWGIAFYLVFRQYKKNKTQKGLDKLK